MKKTNQTQLMRYVMTGGATTAVNYVIYAGLQAAGMDYLIANSIAWLFAVTFSFFANRELVFHSSGSKGREFTQFFSLRLTTLATESLMLFLIVEAMGAGSLISKVMVSAVTVTLNYLTCRYGIFNKGGASDE